MRSGLNYYGRQILKGICVTGLAALGYLGIRKQGSGGGRQGAGNQIQEFGERWLLSVPHDSSIESSYLEERQEIIYDDQNEIVDIDRLFEELEFEPPPATNSENNPPVLVTPIANQTVPHNVLFEIQIPDTTFFDPDGDPLFLSAAKANDPVLPDWLSFNTTMNFFSGTPLIEDFGLTRINVTATDGVGSISSIFTIDVQNQIPILETPIANQTIPHNVLFEMQVLNTTFFDPDGDFLMLNATKANNSILPTWLSFNVTSNIFLGMPLIEDFGQAEIKVTATDGVDSVFSIFAIDVQNQAPVVINPIPNQVVYDNEPFSLIIPYDSFSDPDGDRLNIEIKQADGSNLPEWVEASTGSYLIAPIHRGALDTSGARGVYVSGNYAFVADSYEGLKIIDVSFPSAPSLIGALDTSDYARGVFVSGNYAFVADSGAGLKIIDVSFPSAPSLIGALVTSDRAYSVFVSGNYAFVADYDAGLKIIDVSFPSAPSLIGTLDTSDYARGVFVSGNYAFVADYDAGLKIIDVSFPSAPSLIGALDTSSYALGVFVSGNYAFVADGYAGLKIIDVSLPSAPSLIGALDTYEAFGVFVSGNYAFVADSYEGLKIIQISTITDDLILTFTPEKKHFKPSNGTINLKIIASDGIATAEDNFSITIINQSPIVDRVIQSQRILQDEQFNMLIPYDTFLDRDSDDLTLKIRQSDDSELPDWMNTAIQPKLLRVLGGSSKGVDVKKDRVYIAQGAGGVLIGDISVIEKASVIGKTLSEGKAKKVVAEGNKIYVVNGDTGFVYFASADEKYPILMGKCELPNSAVDLIVRGNKIFIVDDLGKLKIIEIPLVGYEPSIIGSYETTDMITGIDLREEYAYISASNAGLEIVHLGNYSNPQYVTSYATPGSAQAIKLVDDLAYIADNNEGLSILNISEPTLPMIIRNIQTRGNATKIAVLGDYAYVADNAIGMTILDVSNPSLPRIAGTYDTTNEIYEIKVSQDKVFLATSNGVEIVRQNIYLTGIPRAENAGNYELKAAVEDSLGKSIFTAFSLTVEGPPQFRRAIPNQRAKVTQYFSFFFNKNTFVDPNNDVLDYSSGMTLDLAWPSWLQFNPLSGTYFGTPSVENVGVYNITLTADDNVSGIAATTFLIEVVHVPTVRSDIDNLVIVENKRFDYQISANTFEDLSGRELTYQAKQLNGNPLASWLTFNNVTMTFSGYPTTQEIGSVEIQVIASNGEDFVATSFVLSVQRNEAPRLLNPLADLRIATDIPFSFTIPANTFIDSQGDSLNYTITLLNQGGFEQPWPFNAIFRNELINEWPFWLERDDELRQLSGQAPGWVAKLWAEKPYTIRVSATDGVNQAHTYFNINHTGPSLTETIISTLATLFSVGLTAYKLWGWRYLLLNKVNKKSYLKPMQRISLEGNQIIQHQIEIAKEDINDIRAIVNEGGKQIPFGGAMRPNWLHYCHQTNILEICSKDLSVNDIGTVTIQIIDKANIIKEQFDIDIYSMNPALMYARQRFFATLQTRSPEMELAGITPNQNRLFGLVGMRQRRDQEQIAVELEPLATSPDNGMQLS